MHSPRTSALDGLLVADFSQVLSGPYATMLLGDLGAEVVKVERPGGGDDTRAWGPPFIDRQSAYYLSVNRNKRSVVLDLTADAGRRAARDLARRADVLVENFRPGTMERLGLGYDALRGDNPGLVYCSISGFGSGPGAALPGYDFLVQAVGGLMSITGPTPDEPMKVGVASLLLRALNRETLASIVHTMLAPLLSYDERTGGELVRSLTGFLGCDGWWDEAAAELHIHRHTLKHRLRRVEALTGQRLTSPQTRMELWLALQARRPLEQPDTIQMPAAQIPAAQMPAQMPNPAAPPAVSVYVDVGGGLPPATPGPG